MIFRTASLLEIYVSTLYIIFPICVIVKYFINLSIRLKSQATKTYSNVTSKYAVSHSSKNNQAITGLIFANGEQQYTVKNFT